MRQGLLFLVIILFIQTVSALNIDFSCPEIVQNEFSCQITTTNLVGTYDLKLDFVQDGKRISKIWNENAWKSTNYYINNFISDENDREIKIKINITTSDSILGTLKIRETGKTAVDYQKNFSILPNFESPSENQQQTTIQSQNRTNSSKTSKKESIIKQALNNESETQQTISLNPSGENIINLNSVQQERIIYESKDEKIAKFAIYGFCIFLILIVLILLMRL